MAYDGYWEVLKQIFGTKEDISHVTKGADGKPIVLSTEVFDTNFNTEIFEVRHKTQKVN